MTAIGWRKRGGSKPIKFMKKKEINDMEVMIAYLLLKVKEKDWHGVADAANDIRVMEAQLTKGDNNVAR